MALPAWLHRRGPEVAVRGVALGPVRAIVLGCVPSGRFRAPWVALAVRIPGAGEWTPWVASLHQIVGTWESWRAMQHAAVAGHAALPAGALPFPDGGTPTSRRQLVAATAA